MEEMKKNLQESVRRGANVSSDTGHSAQKKAIKNILLFIIVWLMQRLSQDDQLLVGMFRGSCILSMMDCPSLNFGYKTEMARTRQRTAGILMRRYASHIQARKIGEDHMWRDAKPMNAMIFFLPLLPKIDDTMSVPLL